jgi:hypothetical protein
MRSIGFRDCASPSSLRTRAHGPRLVSGIFLALLPFCALAGFILFGIGAAKSTRESRQLRLQAIAKARAAAQARRN